MLPRGCDSPARRQRTEAEPHTSSTRFSSASRSPELSMTMSAFASRSSREACAAIRALASASDMPRCWTSRSIATSVGTSTTTTAASPRRPVSTRRGTSSTTRWSVSCSAAMRRAVSAPTAGMHDPVQVLQGLRVGEDDRGEAGPIESALFVEDRRPEPVDDRRQDGLAGLLELAGDGVRVDHDCPAGGEQTRYRRLPGPDAPGEAHEDHRRTVSPRNGVNHGLEGADHLP